MYLLESIRIEYGEAQLLEYHQERMRQSAWELWQIATTCLSRMGSQIRFPKQGIYKWRLLYNAQGIESSELIPYQRKPIKSLKLLPADNLDYSLKYADRTSIEQLYKQRGHCDDILICKQGYITDSSYCNVALQHHTGDWHTPNAPLLKGVMRQYLIDNHIIKATSILKTDLKHYTKIRLINAMMPWENCIELPINALQTSKP